MEETSLREHYRGSFERPDSDQYPEYCNIRGPKRGSSSVLRQPYRTSVHVEETIRSPLQPMYRKRIHFGHQEAHHRHFEDNHFLRCRRSASRNRVAPTHECVNSRERSSQERPLRRYEKPYVDYAPPELVPTFNPSDAFKEDVLKIVKPLIQDRTMTVESGNPDSARNAYKEETKTAHFGESEELKIMQNQIKSLESEVKSLRATIGKVNPDAIFREINKMNQSSSDIRKIVQENIQALNIEPPDFSHVQKDFQKEIDKLNKKIISVERVAEENKKGSGTDNSSDIRRVESEMNEIVSKINELSTQNDYVTDTLDNLSVDIEATKNLAEKATTRIKSLEEEDHFDQSDAKAMILDLEKKISKSLTTGLSSVEDQIRSVSETEIGSLQNDISQLSQSLNKVQNSYNSVITKEEVNSLIVNAIPEEKQDEGLRSELDFIQETIEQMQENIEGFSETFRGLPTKASILKAVDEKLGKLKQDQALKDASQDIKMSEDAKIDQQEFEKLSQRVAKFEEIAKDINKLEGEVQSVKNDLKTEKTNISSLHKEVEDYSINEIISQVNTNTDKIELLEKNVEEIDSLQDKVSEINSLKDKVSGLSSLEGKVSDLHTLEEKVSKLNSLDEKVTGLSSQIKTLSESIPENNNDETDQKFADLEYKISELEDQVQNNENSEEINTLNNKIKSVESKIEQEIKQNVEEITIVKTQMQEIPTSSAPAEPSIGEEAFAKFKNDIIQQQEAFEEDHQAELTKMDTKIAEIRKNVDEADEGIKSSIKKLKESTTEETNIVFGKILSVKNEIIEDSRRLKEKFDRIDKEEDEKQEFVLKEIKRIETKLESQNEEVSKAMHDLGSQSTNSETVAVKTDFNEMELKFDGFKEELQGQMEEFKNENKESQNFERDRILNCVQELNEVKTLIDTKIEEYDTTQGGKFKEINEKSEELKEQIKTIESNFGSLEEEIKKFSEKHSNLDEKVHEVEQKYGRVAKQANEISKKVDQLESTTNIQSDPLAGGLMADLTDKPLQIEEKEQSKFEMTDLFKNFKDEQDADKEQPKGRYGGEEEEEEKEEVVEDPMLSKQKKQALKGIDDLDQYQKSHPTIEQQTSLEQLQKWKDRVNKATEVKEIESLREEILDEAGGYDILEEDLDDEGIDDDQIDDMFEDMAGLDKPEEPATDLFSGIQVAADGDKKKDDSAADLDGQADSDEFSYEDDFEF